jgi:Tfp pilus assembly protein FimT
MEKTRPIRGFSLPELLVMVGIATIMAAAAMPYLLTAVQNSEFNAAVRQIAGDARLARSLAVSRGDRYRIHAGGDAAIGDPTLNNSYRVERRNPVSGWPATTANMATSADVLNNWQDVSTHYRGVTIQSVLDGGLTAVDGPIFNSTGASVDSSNALRAVNITLHKPDGTTKVIQVDPAGNVRVP